MIITVLQTVAFSFIYAVPGFIFVKKKSINPTAIPAFSRILMYVCAPCLTLYSFNNSEFSVSLLKQMGIFFCVTLLITVAVIGLFYLIVKKHTDDVRYRVSAVCASLGNVAFLGVPVLESVLPNHPEAVAFSAVYFVSMNLVGWTLASGIIAKDKKYIKISKVILNPAFLSLIVALPLFVTGTHLLPGLDNVVTVLGKMTTPMCMLIMGMRLATVKPKVLFLSPLQYITIAVKQIIFPCIAFLLCFILPLDEYVKTTLIILCSCPVASVVQSYAELIKKGQETAANEVLLGTILSVITLPIMCMILL